MAQTVQQFIESLASPDGKYVLQSRIIDFATHRDQGFSYFKKYLDNGITITTAYPKKALRFTHAGIKEVLDRVETFSNDWTKKKYFN